MPIVINHRQRGTFSFYANLHPTRCVSSKLMSYVNSWRNLQQRDVSAFDNGKSFTLIKNCQDNWFRLRILVAQCAYSILAISSTAEFITYLGVYIITIPWVLIDSGLHNRLDKLTSSAYVTLIWTINNFVFNFFTKNFLTFESFARIYYKHNFSIISDVLGFPSYEVIVGEENIHRNFIYNWWLDHDAIGVPAGIELEVDRHEPIVHAGKSFMKEVLNKYERLKDLYEDEDGETFLSYFQMLDPLAINWVLKASIFELVKEDSNINPNFLKLDVCIKIASLRSDPIFQQHLHAISSNQDLRKAMEELFTKPLKEFDQIDIGQLENEHIRDVFQSIAKVAALENQNSTYLTSCWGELLRDLPQEEFIEPEVREAVLEAV